MDKQEPKVNRLGGDTLAQFIAFELAETYDADASDGEHSVFCPVWFGAIYS